MKRILLFLGTNLAVLIVLSITARLLGLDEWLGGQGTSLTGLLAFAALFGFGGAFLSLAMSKWLAKRTTGARVIESPRDDTERWLVETVSRQARMAGVATPEVAIYEAPEMNAFATGMTRDRSLVAVSTGLLRGMSRAEAEAVLAHEVSHVANGDMVTLALIQGVVNTFVIFLARVIGSLVDRMVFRSEDGRGPGYFAVTIAAELVLGILASIVVLWFSRRREFRADAGGAALAGRANMIAALQRLGQGTAESTLPKSLQAMGVAGTAASGLRMLFMSHPPIEQRIQILRAAGEHAAASGSSMRPMQAPLR